MIDLILCETALQTLPGLVAWGFTAEQLARSDPLIELPAVDARLLGASTDTFATHPRIAPWRNAYRDMGLKPSEVRCSVEQLARRHIAGRPASTGVWTVDLYNAVSLSHLVPMGGYDADLLPEGPIELRLALPQDRFEPIGGKGTPATIQDNVVVYASGHETLCWAINHKDAAHTALSGASRRALFVSEAVDAQGAADSLQALGALARCLERIGARCSTVVPFSKRSAK